MTKTISFQFTFYIFLVFITNSCQSDINRSSFILLDSSSSGIDFENTLTETDSLNIIQYLYFYNGAGVGTGDFNNDGYPDIFFAANQDAPQLYINKGQENISFRNVSQEAGLDTISGWSTGVSLVDINRDGFLDVYLCQVGNFKSFIGRNRLLINQGLDHKNIPTFLDKTSEYGLDYSGLSTHAAFFDYDIDGDLDLYVLNHSVHRSSNYGKALLREKFNDQYGDRFYENNNGRFINKTQDAGLYASRIGYGLGIAVSDIDQNGYPDIYIGNDFHENDYLYLNQGDGTFDESIEESTGHNSQFTMGVDIADINEDGMPDILTLDMKPADPFIRQTTVTHDPNTIFQFKNQLAYHYQYPKNHLQIQQGIDENNIPVFSEIASLANIDATDWSWSGLVDDFNNDGLKDIFVSNGILRRPNDLDYLNYIANEKVQLESSDLEIALKMPDGQQNNVFFFNNDNYQFSNFQLTEDFGISNGASYADFDLDGDLDIVTNNVNQKAFIYENQSAQNYLQISLHDENNTDLIIGSKIIATSNGQQYYRDINPYRGFMSSIDPTITIGLGAQNKVDSLLIFWPDGYRQLIENIEANQRLSISKSQGKAHPKTKRHSSTLFSKTSIADVKIKHIEDDKINEQYSTLHLLNRSKQGPNASFADINQDGIQDIFISNASSSPSELFISEKNGIYKRSKIQTLNNDAIYEDISSCIIDIDGDSDFDLLIGHSTDEFIGNSIRYYINHGGNNYEKRIDPIILENPSVIAPSDFDQDGDIDYFVGSGFSEKFDESPSAIMVNDGSGTFKRFGTSIENLGQVSDAAWGDIDNDGDEDLIVVSEWKTITLLINKENGFSKREIPNSEGLWKSLKMTDIDLDGDMDLIVGNLGLNSSVQASEKNPLMRKHFPVEASNTLNPIIYFDQDAVLQSSDEIVKRIPSLKKELTSYQDFATYILSEETKSKSVELGKAVTLKSTIFYNNGLANFEPIVLPIEAQFSSVNAISVNDFNHDGLPDMIIAGNEFGYTSSFGRQDANYGLVLIQQKNNTFKHLSASKSGLYLKGMVRDILHIGNHNYLFTINNGESVMYTLNNFSQLF